MINAVVIQYASCGSSEYLLKHIIKRPSKYGNATLKSNIEISVMGFPVVWTQNSPVGSDAD